MATQRLLMATPAKRVLDFDGVQSPNTKKNNSGNSNMVDEGKINGTKEVEEEPQALLKLCKPSNDSCDNPFLNSDSTVKKIKEFTPVKEDEESGNNEPEQRDRETSEFQQDPFEVQAHNDDKVSNDLVSPEKNHDIESKNIVGSTDVNSDVNGSMVSHEGSKQCLYKDQDIDLINTKKSDDLVNTHKPKNDSNSALKTTAGSKVGLNICKGYSAVTKASMNRAKTSVMSNSVSSSNISGSGAGHGRSNSVARTSNTNASNKPSNPCGKNTNLNQMGMNKSMTSSTSSSGGGTDISMSLSQSSSTSDKPVSYGSTTKLPSTMPSTTKKISSAKIVPSVKEATVASNSSTGIIGDGSPKTQRLSLVQRQARFAVSASTITSTTTTNTGRAPFTRSATTPSFSNRGRGVTGNNNRPLTARPSNSRCTLGNRNISNSNRNQLSCKASNSTPTTNQANSRTLTAASNGTLSGLQPFGSTSSISSSGSSRSWADTVKGLRSVSSTPCTTKSVENLSGKNGNEQDKENRIVDDKIIIGNQDEGGEWETVKPRTRSRISPINSQLENSRAKSTHSLTDKLDLKRSSSFNGNTQPTTKKDAKGTRMNNGLVSKGIELRNDSIKTSSSSINPVTCSEKSSKHYSRERFQIPSSAVSMPSLSTIDKNEKHTSLTKPNTLHNRIKTEQKYTTIKKCTSKGIGMKGRCNKETESTATAFIEQSKTKASIAGSGSGSSSESLEENVNKKHRTNINGVAIKNRSSMKNILAVTTKNKKAKLSMKQTKNSNSEVKLQSIDNSCKNETDVIITKRKTLSNQDCLSENRLSETCVENKVCSENPDKENIPFDGISSCYPHQLDTCVEDDECEGDAGEAEIEADSELAENEAAIALIEEEEESLAREIKETECSQLADDALDSANECDQEETGNIEGPVEPNTTDISPLTSKSKKKNGEINSTLASSHEEEESETNDPSTPSKYEALFEGLSWIDQIELEEQLIEARMPGRAIEIHEKLSSPARKREPQEAFKHHQEKQNNARVRRQMFQDEKAQRLVALNTRIEEVISHREFLLSQRREMIIKKMAKAEAKRQQHINGIRKKAGEEETKLKEIAFINELSAQNTRIDMLAQNQAADEKAEERLAEFAGERAKKAEQREAKEARAEERRRKLEAKRIKDVEALRIKILRREERIQEEQEQIRKDREEAAREKNRDREEKLSTVRAAEKDMKEELQEKIQQKMEEAAKRHQEKLQQVRHKAFELSIKRCSTDEGELEGGALLHPMLLAYDPKKKCEVCCVLIHNEVQLQSHLRGKKHSEKLRNFVIAENEKSKSRPSSSDNLIVGRKMSGEEVQKYNLRYIVDAPVDEPDPKIIQLRERNKALKKRAKKIKSRMAIRAADFEKMLLSETSVSKVSDAPHKAKIGKSLRDIEKLLASQGKGAWPNNTVSSLERALGEIVRSFQGQKVTAVKDVPVNQKINSMVVQDKQAFYEMSGFVTLSKLFHLLADASPSTSLKQIDQRPLCVIPLKSIVLCCKTWTSACLGHRKNTEFVLKSNHLSTISDILLHRLQILIPELTINTGKKKDDTDLMGDQLQWPAPDGPQTDPVAKEIMISLAQCLEDLAVYLTLDQEKKLKTYQDKTPGLNGPSKQVSAFDDLALRVHDQVSYMIATGIVDKLAAYFHSVQDPIDDRPEVGEFLLASLDLMSALTVCVEALSTKSATPSNNSDAVIRGPHRELSSSSSVADGAEGSSSSTTG